MRRLAAMLIVLLLSGCGASVVPHATPARPSSAEAAKGPSWSVPGSPPPVLDVTATSALSIHATNPPAPFGPPAGVQDIVFSSSTDGWLAAGVQAGSNGWISGIWRTTDSGQSWYEVWSGFDVQLSRIGLLPDGASLYASGDRLATQPPFLTPVWLTSSNGSTWAAMTPTVPADAMPMASVPVWSSVHLDFVSPSVGFAAGDPEDTYGQSLPIWTTQDGGKIWTDLPSPPGFESTGGVDFTTPNDGWITGMAKGTCDQIWHTTDGGQTWAPVPATCPPYSLDAITFDGSRVGFASGGTIPFVKAQTGIMKTKNGGASWTTVYHTTGNTNSNGPVTHIAFRSPTQVWAWGGSCKMGANGPCGGPVLISTDGGDTWTKESVGALTIAFAGGTAWAVQPQDGGLVQTSGSGAHWSAPITLPPTARIEGILAARHTSDLWLITQGGTFQSTDDGSVWTTSPLRLDGSEVVATSGDVLFSAGGNTLKVTRDGGTSWNPLPVPAQADRPAGIDGIAFANPHDGWMLLPTTTCRNCVTVERTTNGGQTWAVAGQANLSGDQPGFAFSTSLGAIVSTAAVPSGTSQLPSFNAALGLSHDAGRTWNTILLPDGMVCSAPSVVSNTVWLPCQQSDGLGVILKSVDGGMTWHQYSAGQVVPYGVVMTDAEHGQMLAAAAGALPEALYDTSDGGITWTQVWPHLPDWSRTAARVRVPFGAVAPCSSAETTSPV